MRHIGSYGAGIGSWIRLAWRGRRRITTVAVALATALGGTLVADVPTASASLSETVVITATGLLTPVAAVLQVGGSILTKLGLIDGVVASIPTLLEPVLAALPGITVTPDLSITIGSAPESDGPHTPSDVFLQETGATQLAAAGDTGHGVTVAVLDTGIDKLPDFSGRVVGGVDLTGANKPFQDSYGHGTFVAGLIAGDGTSSGGQYSGEAPGAKLVSIKVAGATGVTSLGAVLAGLQWAADHRSALHIKVLNISLGIPPTGSTVTSPLDQAVEAVWNAGIAVVVSAGNAGPFDGTILSPGDDPLVITVGALDDMATASVRDDEMTDFSSIGPTSVDGEVKPDLVTSGRSVVSLAAPGSTVYNDYPSARIGSANFVGSGTSFSAAITSGAAALVLADHPGLTPDQVKARLLGTVNPGPVGNPFADGHGALDAYAAATAKSMNLRQSVAGLAATPVGTTVSLAPTSAVDTWNTTLWSGLSWKPAPPDGWLWDGVLWDGGEWNALAWVGKAWNGWAWDGAAWNGVAWVGKAWNDAVWDGSSWNGSAWDSDAWDSSAWG
ncbi:MAG TPA: S8 family serine peptidase [Streptosporangiaceae bacterium]|jgi:serine protease AprX|nr:S8 family serine peptidase [Streptosporangiaceae bacterium]